MRFAIGTVTAYRSWPAHGLRVKGGATAVTPIAVIQSASRTGDIVLFICWGKKGIATILTLPFMPQCHCHQTQYDYGARQVKQWCIDNALVHSKYFQYDMSITAILSGNLAMQLPNEGCMEHTKIGFEIPRIGKRHLTTWRWLPL